jgi:hypothetical protein
MKRWISSAALFVGLMVPAPGPAQVENPSTEVLVAYAYNLRHRGAAEALDLVVPLLSSRGAVELQPGGNALVVRDTARALAMIRPQLEAFDHPFEPLRLRVQIIRAGRGGEPAGPSPQLPAGVLSRLHELLKYESYSLLAGSELSIEDGMAVVQDMGDDYRVDFRLRHQLSDGRASLEGFRLSRGGTDAFVPLIHANLNLDLDKPMVLGLAPSEDSDAALMLVIETLPMRAAARDEE